MDSPKAWAGYVPANFDRDFRGNMAAGEALAESRNIKLFEVSTATGEGLEQLKWGIAEKMRELRNIEQEAAAKVERTGSDLPTPAVSLAERESE